MYPDPVLTANVYCDRRLDELIVKVIAPFWRELVQQDIRCYLWFVRYARCGEHLKIRLHGSSDLKPVIKSLLSESVERFLASLEGPEEQLPRRSRQDAPPIDTEDRATADYPDRTLLWTEYGRSHVSLGGKPFLDDDGYAARFTACLGRGCEIVMATLAPEGQEGPFPHKLRQTTLLKMLITGLAEIAFPPAIRSSYLSYHRDWLLRFTLIKGQAGREKLQEILARFELQRERMGTALIPLYQTAAEKWEGGTRTEIGGLEAAWRASLANLLGYITPLCNDPDYRLDPLAVDPVFSPVFKVFHGIANQIGLDLLDEAFAHHLLLHAVPAPVEA